MIEHKNNDKKFEVVLIDYGFATNYLEKNGKHLIQDKEVDLFRGNIMFASLNQLRFG